MTSRFSRSDSVVFRATKELPWGGLSNMAAGYPLLINGQLFLTVEALYQALRYADEVSEEGELIQELIRRQRSPMAAKMVSKKYYSLSRDDWEVSRVKIMDWCLRVKLHVHWEKFGTLLTATGSLPIVEESHKDRFWGAVPTREDHNVLEGENILGSLLMQLRNIANQGIIPDVSKPPVKGMTIFGSLPYRVAIGGENLTSTQISWLDLD